MNYFPFKQEGVSHSIDFQGKNFVIGVLKMDNFIKIIKVFIKEEDFKQEGNSFGSSFNRVIMEEDFKLEGNNFGSSFNMVITEEIPVEQEMLAKKNK